MIKSTGVPGGEMSEKHEASSPDTCVQSKSSASHASTSRGTDVPAAVTIEGMGGSGIPHEFFPIESRASRDSTRRHAMDRFPRTFGTHICFSASKSSRTVSYVWTSWGIDRNVKTERASATWDKDIRLAWTFAEPATMAS
jgi:hypothetical protein